MLITSSLDRSFGRLHSAQHARLSAGAALAGIVVVIAVPETAIVSVDLAEIFLHLHGVRPVPIRHEVPASARARIDYSRSNFLGVGRDLHFLFSIASAISTPQAAAVAQIEYIADSIGCLSIANKLEATLLPTNAAATATLYELIDL
jgi:hypothetical protein